MCGIAGLINHSQFSNSELKTLSQKMIQAISYRGPDHQAVWTDADVAFAHARLSIIDTSPRGNQPMLMEDDSAALIFNGEVYNFKELKAELLNTGSTFYSESDAEVVLKSCFTYGVEKAIQKYRGMFAFAYFDRQQQKLFLVRDRVGVKPLYYGFVGENFVFASELKALFLHPKWQGLIDQEALSLFIRHGYVPGPKSIFQNISKLKPGHFLVYDLKTKKIDIQSYWSPSKFLSLPKMVISEENAIAQTKTLIENSVRYRMVSDVPVGAFLSGGIDSSIVVAAMQKFSEQKVKTYTIGFSDKRFDESKHAQNVAKAIGAEHSEYILDGKEALSLVQNMPEIFDEPFADSSQLPTYFVARFARKDVKVVLTGDGADEFFAGYVHYAMAPTLWRKIKTCPYFLRKSLARLICLLGPNILRALTFGERKFATKLMKMAEVLYHSQSERDVFHNLISKTSFPERYLLNPTKTESYYTNFLPKKSENWSGLDILSWIDEHQYLPDQILAKTDRATMACGLEAREPLLDNELMAFALQLPDAMKRRGQTNKWILRQICYQYYSKELVDRPKQGFEVPIENWLRQDLKLDVDSVFSKKFLEETQLFSIEEIQKTWSYHLQGKRNQSKLLWNLYVFLKWYDCHRKHIGIL